MSYRSPWYAPLPTLPYAPEYGFLGHVPANAIRGPGYTFVPALKSWASRRYADEHCANEISRRSIKPP